MQTIKKTYFTIGPSQLYPGLAKMMNEALRNNVASISHRSDDFRKIYQQTKQALIRLLKLPANYQVFFLGSSIEIMERIITSCVKQNCIHLVNGAFGEKFYETAKIFNKKARKINYGNGGFKAEELQFPKETEMICLTQNETSTGVAIPVTAINKLRQLNPRPLLAVDIVSSMPDVNLNWQLIDLGFFSVQKGFGLPAGMAVLIASPKAIRQAEKLIKTGEAIPGFHNLLT
ncbi:aminotransferase class V-fold PLP-dependent enzyme, partial [Patescibacteria group bacterium]|nr:aminotransferase class V-fold PLP-dependent enzyme [Patescibacteria group bacterium]MBU1500090.1 aminotransferase class V-fold PLP-dependent enzyme [Patescibacteria group bacterium]